jgi:hypothetical protein
VKAIDDVVDKFLSAWERIEKIRKMRAELKEIGLKGKALAELTSSSQLLNVYLSFIKAVMSAICLNHSETLPIPSSKRS